MQISKHIFFICIAALIGLSACQQTAPTPIVNLIEPGKVITQETETSLHIDKEYLSQEESEILKKINLN